MSPPVSPDDRRRLIDAANAGTPVKDAARILQLSKSSAHRIVKQHRDEGRVNALPRGGRKDANTKVDDETRQFIENEIEQNPFLTLTDMASLVNNHFPNKPPITYRTVDRVLQGLLYTVKLATKGTDVRQKTNSAESVAARREYAQFILDLDPAGRLVFLDETGFNLWTRRSQGRSVKGRAVRRAVTTQRGPNVTVCMATAAEFGLVHATVFRGGQNNDRFQNFIDDLCDRCQTLDAASNWVVVMDGPYFHRAARIPPHLQDRISIRILPPYSPFLNPVELANSSLKAHIKRRLALPEVVAEEAAPPEGVNHEEWRFMLMERIARESLDEAVTAQKTAQWELHCFRQLGRCLNEHHF